MLCITELLPPGKTPLPSDNLAVQWYYMTYHCADRHEYVKLGKKLSNEMIEMLTAYFQSLFAQRKSDGALSLCIRAKRTIANDIHKKGEARCTNHELCDAREHERG